MPVYRAIVLVPIATEFSCDGSDAAWVKRLADGVVASYENTESACEDKKYKPTLIELVKGPE